LLLPFRRQPVEARIVLQGPFLFCRRHVFVVAQPIPGMTLRGPRSLLGAALIRPPLLPGQPEAAALRQARRDQASRHQADHR
jgi:hypothetical protein